MGAEISTSYRDYCISCQECPGQYGGKYPQYPTINFYVLLNFRNHQACPSQLNYNSDFLFCWQSATTYAKAAWEQDPDTNHSYPSFMANQTDVYNTTEVYERLLAIGKTMGYNTDFLVPATIRDDNILIDIEVHGNAKDLEIQHGTFASGSSIPVNSKSKVIRIKKKNLKLVNLSYFDTETNQEQSVHDEDGEGEVYIILAQ